MQTIAQNTNNEIVRNPDRYTQLDERNKPDKRNNFLNTFNDFGIHNT